MNGAVFVAQRVGLDRILTLRHGRHLHGRRGLPRRRADRSRARRASDRSRVRAPSLDVSRSAPAAARSPPSRRSRARCGSARESPGADPGPAGYGRGGTEPTVTDANVVLGYLPPVLLGGAMPLDVDAARTARPEGRRRARRRRSPRRRRASSRSSTRTCSARCASSPCRRASTRRTSRSSPFGGAGGLHANALAETLGLLPGDRPARAGRALGARLPRGRRPQRVRPDLHPHDRPRARPPTCGRAPRELGSQARRVARRARASSRRAARSPTSLDMRYYRQGFELPIASSPPARRARPRRRSPSASAGAARPALRVLASRAPSSSSNLRARAVGRVHEARAARPPGRSRRREGRRLGSREIWTEDEHAACRSTSARCSRPGHAARRARGRDHAVRRDDARAARPRRASVDGRLNLLIEPGRMPQRTSPLSRLRSTPSRST